MMKSRLLGVWRMNNYILEGEYLEIVMELLGEHYNVRSLIKLVFMSFCIKNGKRSSYGGRKKDFVEVFFSSLNVKLLSHSDELAAILEVIHKMKSSGWIEIDDDNISVLKELKNFKCENKFLVGCRDKDINPIREVNKLDSRAFVEEVLRHV